jgi:hypothetical protein
MLPILIALLIIIVGMTYILVTTRRRKRALRNFNADIEYKNAPRYMASLCSHELIEVKIQMKELPIDAITQCIHITHSKNEPLALASNAVNTDTKEAEGMKPKYHVAQHVSYLVLSGKELHYLFYEEGDIREHFVLDESRMQNARLEQVSGMDKLRKTHSICRKKLNKLHFNIDSGSMEILFYETITDAPEGSLNETDTFIPKAKNALIGKYFKDQLKIKYPSLYTPN